MFERNVDCFSVEQNLDRGTLSKSDQKHLQGCISCQSYQRAAKDAPAVLALITQSTRKFLLDDDLEEHSRAALFLLRRAMVLVNSFKRGKTPEALLCLNLRSFLYALYQVQSHNPEQTLDQLKTVPLIVAWQRTKPRDAHEMIKHWFSKNWEQLKP